MGRLDGKVALISGGARSMGAVETRLFAREGARVVFGDLLDDEGGKVEVDVGESGGEATYVHLDVTKEESWRDAIALAEGKYGRLDILVNNAGIIRPNLIEDTTEEMWDQIMEVNAKGVFLGTKLAIPAMRRAGGGSIVNISSVAALMSRRNSAAAYSASKGAVRIFSKVTAMQHAADRIRCNSVHPGPIDTPMLDAITPSAALMEDRVRGVPLGRIGTSEDVALGVLYLASDEASWVTGVELVIDGGITAQ